MDVLVHSVIQPHRRLEKNFMYENCASGCVDANRKEMTVIKKKKQRILYTPLIKPLECIWCDDALVHVDVYLSVYRV